MRDIRSDLAWALISVAGVALVLQFATASLRLPEPLPATAALSEFSAMRAAKYVEAIAVAPHPTGSAENAAVRDYLLKQLADLKITGSVQEATLQIDLRGRPRQKFTVRNVLATIPGKGHSEAIMLVAHYDSAPQSPGASDNAAGVATLLETARALLSGPVLRNDIHLLFTDGEESGLAGARAFVNDSLQKSVAAVVLNFDSRGRTGPVVMFESAGAARLIRELARSCPHPVAVSFSADVYQFMGNATDFTVFRRAGYSGLNFAFFADRRHYHRRTDSIANLDPRALQQEGSYALGLAKALGQAETFRTTEADQVYFNVGSALVSYSSQWTMPLVLFTFALLLGLTALSVRRGIATIGGLGAGMGAALTAMGVTVAAGLILYHWLGDALGANQRADVPISLYFAVQAGICVSVVSMVDHLFSRRSRPIERLLTVYGCWLLLAVVLARTFRGGTYLFVWPPLVGLLVLGGFLIAGRDMSSAPASSVCLGLATLPALVLFLPALGLISYAVGSPAVATVTMLCITLITELFTPPLRIFQGNRAARFHMTAAGVAVTLVLFAVVRSYSVAVASASLPRAGVNSVLSHLLR